MGHGKLGEALVAAGRLDEGMKETDRSIDLTNALVTDFSANIRWLLYQEWAHLRKGRTLMSAGRYAAAYDEFTAYLNGVEGMRRRDPNYVSALYDESNAHQWRGDALRAQNKLDDAASEYEVGAPERGRGRATEPADQSGGQEDPGDGRLSIGPARRSEGLTRARRLDVYRDCFDIKFNRDTWTPRSNVPEDVTAECRSALVRLGAPP